MLHDLLVLVGVGFPYSPPLYIVLGGLFVGLLQQRLLKPLSSRANWWVPASALGWALPAAAIALGDSGILGPLGSLVSLVGMFLGGAMLGAVSGGGIVWILQNPEIKNPH